MSKKYYGSQTEFALTNFPFSIHPTQKEFIYAIVQVKQAAAHAHLKTGDFTRELTDAIVDACNEVLDGKLDDQFVTVALQGGAGTSINMNVNEVLANRATEILSKKGINTVVHPNDHINKSQSTNDANPSGLKIASIRLGERLLKSVEILIASLEQKGKQYAGVVKLGRTHLQDAVPTTLGAEFYSYADILKSDKKRIIQSLEYFHELNLGGTAIGNSINASMQYQKEVYKALQKITQLNIKPATNLMAGTSSQTDFVFLSQAIVSLTVDASKMASDLRLMSSGPRGGLGEIKLAKLQSGSSIMPGKVNPILPESVNQLYYMVSGNNVTIEHAAHAAQLELGVMLPILADRLITSLKLSSEVLENFALQCIDHIIANEKRCKKLLEDSTAYATLLNPVLGYDKVTKAVEKTIKEEKTFKQVLLEEQLLTEEKFEQAIQI